MCVKVTLFLFSDYKMTPCCSLRGPEGKVNSLIMVIRNKNQQYKLPAGSRTTSVRLISYCRPMC